MPIANLNTALQSIRQPLKRVTSLREPVVAGYNHPPAVLAIARASSLHLALPQHAAPSVRSPMRGEAFVGDNEDDG
ncbi:hypothetical protein V8E54_008711 [Elaphomyces granulatus]